MTVTEARPDDEVADSAALDHLDPLPPPPAEGIVAVLGTSDHKTVGRLYIVASLVGGVLGLVLGALANAEGITADEVDVLSTDTFFQVLTLHQVSIFLLFLAPLFLGLGLYVVPLQVGARAAAFPRLGALSFWGWAVGAVLVIVGYLLNGGPGGGDVDAVEMSLLALAMVIASLLAGAVSLVTTVATMRPAGMALHRVPVFSWAMFVACGMWLVTFPVLLANLLLIELGVRYGGTVFGEPLNHWSQLVWLFRQPAVYVFAIPALGVIGDVVATMVGKPYRNHGMLLGAIGAFGALSFGAWAQLFFDPTITREATYIVVAFAIVAPTLAVLGGFADQLRSGRPRVSSALVLALFGLLLLLVAVVVGALNVVDPLDLNGTSSGPGHAALVFGAGALAALAGTQHWGVKIWGVQPNEALARLVALLLGVGVALWGIGLTAAGLVGQAEVGPSGVVPVESGAEALMVFATIGVGVAAAAVALHLLITLPAAMRDRTPAAAEADPWGSGLTLEWSAPSPPPYGNFDEPVRRTDTAAPLHHARLALEEHT